MMLEMWLLVGFMAVASNPSPYFAALGLVVGAGSGCLILMKSGVVFLSLTLFLVYLGGMMVVFGYSTALLEEPYPEGWGGFEVLCYLGVYVLVVVVGWFMWGEGKSGVVGVGCDAVAVEWWGVSGIFGEGGWVLLVGGWALLLTLFVVLEVVRGHYSGALRAV
uniref:NADH-ubiquinone oxidoreductase chain 6 n=1 Tax=Synapturanus sp. MNHN-RA-2020.0087 TaxID=2877831 RepID=A0A8K1LYW1_9NEOB|nr:NADH dehydrogenase subunit 6 [Synapturanus sp. MNHN-RA-2020.0087]